MMDCKVKSVFKALCVVSVFVIICYIEGKYNLIFKEGEKEAMTEAKIFYSEYEIFGSVQGKSWNLSSMLTLSIKLGIHEFVLCCFRCFLPKGKFGNLMIIVNDTRHERIYVFSSQWNKQMLLVFVDGV